MPDPLSGESVDDPGSLLAPEAALGLLTKGLQTLIGRAGMVVVSFGFAVALARALSPDERGNFALLVALNSVTAVVANFAVGKAAIHHVGKGLVSLDAAGSSTLELSLLSGGLAGAVLIPIALGFRASILPGLLPAMIVAAILLGTARLIREYLGGVMVAVGRPLDYVYASLAQPAGALAVLVVLMALGMASLGGVVVAWSIGLGLSGLASVALMARYARPWPPAPRSVVASLGKFGLKTYPAFVARFLNLKLDQFLVRLLSSAAALGQYAVAVSVGELLIRIPTILLWAVSGAISTRKQQESSELTAQFCRWTIVILGATVLVIGVAAPLAVPFVFGGAYRPAVRCVLILLPGMVCYAPAVIITEYFIVQRGQPGKAALIAGMSMLTSTALNFPLTPGLHEVGASIASSISYMVMFATGVFLFRRDSGRTLRDVAGITSSDVRTILSATRQLLRFRTPAPKPGP